MDTRTCVDMCSHMCVGMCMDTFMLRHLMACVGMHTPAHRLDAQTHTHTPVHTSARTLTSISERMSVHIGTVSRPAISDGTYL